MQRFVLTLSLGVSLFSTALADVRLPGIFVDHMVVQRDQAIPVWGWADAGEEVAVQLSGHSQSVTADAKGLWMVKIDPLPAGGPHELTVTGRNKLNVKDVLVGEVWLCSGQSNMAMTVSRSMNFEKEQTLADLPQIRMFKVAANSKPKIQTDCKGSWQIASADTVGGFSATAWFFGRKLHRELNVPIGLVNSSWGGTDIAAWTSRSAQEKVAAIARKLTFYDKQNQGYSAEKAKTDLQVRLKRWEERKASGKTTGRKPRRQPDPQMNRNRPSNLFNGMINPLVPYSIRGAIWYQGERNSKSIEGGKLYAKQLKTMITDWRTRWNQGDFPFITVQLPNFHAKQTKPVENTGWVMVREAELKSLQIKNTGIAITTDVGMANDIHPKNKQTVGLRLALWAMGTTYEHDIVYSGPIYSFNQYRGSAGDGKLGRMEVIIRHIGDELKTSDGKPLTGFALAGKDKVFHNATANIVNGTMLNVTSKQVPNPVALRYNWADNPIGNLVNSADLPAAPFRTDNWEIATPGVESGSP
jgi:sialate O-acetylesterase